MTEKTKNLIPILVLILLLATAAGVAIMGVPPSVDYPGGSCGAEPLASGLDSSSGSGSLDGASTGG